MASSTISPAVDLTFYCDCVEAGEYPEEGVSFYNLCESVMSHQDLRAAWFCFVLFVLNKPRALKTPNFPVHSDLAILRQNL